MNTNLKKELEDIFAYHELKLEFRLIDFNHKIIEIYEPIIKNGLRHNIQQHGTSNRESILD